MCPTDAERVGYYRRWREQNPDAASAHNRRWRERNPGYAVAHARSLREREPLAYAAWKTYRTALRNGTLVRPSTCSNCDVACKPDGHHRDYSKPLEVVWLCRRCHRREHSESHAAGTRARFDGRSFGDHLERRVG